MMIHAYNELYLDDAINNLGDMMEYAVCNRGYNPDDFLEQFINSGIAEQFGKGNPKYVAGVSGVELAEEVIRKTQDGEEQTQQIYYETKGPEYWAGHILAYYQWYRNIRFEKIIENGLTMSKIMSMYILHEADASKFVAVADQIMMQAKEQNPTNLQKIRKARGITQRELSRVTGVSLRMIQLYEQKQNDINKAQVGVVLRLANALGCSVEELME